MGSPVGVTLSQVGCDVSGEPAAGGQLHCGTKRAGGERLVIQIASTGAACTVKALQSLYLRMCRPNQWRTRHSL
jgi:hypothetical protein